MKGTFDAATQKAYDDKSGSYFTRASVVYYLRGFSDPQEACLQKASLPQVCLTQTYAPTLKSSVLYLDCGRWGGHGGGVTNWPQCRDFGVVFGRAAALCGYGKRHGTPEDTATHETASAADISKSSDCQTIVDFVAQLSTTQMGPALIRQMLECPIRSNEQKSFQGEPLRDRIYVFLGDLHLPATDDGNHGDLLEKSASYGRLVGAISSDLLLAPTTLNERIDWYGNYHGVPGDIGADVFQDARADLEVWLTTLGRYQSSAQGIQRPIHLIQTGDMFDFWIGLHRYFRDDAGGQVVLEPDAAAFVTFWLEQTINHTQQGQVARALQAVKSTLNVTFLYGNHDNYLAVLPVAPHPSGIEKRAKTFTDRNSNNHTGAVYSEHGHRMDSANRDGSTRGHGFTQAAFFYPTVRNYEDQGRKAVDLFTGDPPERIAYFGEAADLCLANGCSVFVMGHTHHGLLKRIEIVGPPG